VKVNPTIRPTSKQDLAYQKLLDDTTKYILFGGGAGGGKSWLGCEWLLTRCYFYPETRWFIGREELKRLRDSTFVTFFKVFKYMFDPFGVTSGQMFKYNGSDHYFDFFNGSRVDLLDLKYLPSDPLYERYGSVEYTGGWIEEGGEVDFGAFDILKTRIGRHLNDKYNTLGKILITSNPKKNWIYHTFYKPDKENILPKDHAFIKALVQDNKYIESRYLESLQGLKDQNKKERLLYGNWEYDDDPAKLMDYDAITDLFTNQANGQGNYLTADIARFGKDKTILMAWQGYRVIEVESALETSITDSAKMIEEMSKRHNIPRSKIVVDEDGLGGGVKDILRCKGFVNNSTPQKVKGERENYQNLKAQCYFRLAERVNQRTMAVECDSETRERITEELEVIKQKDPDKDNKMNVIPKDKIKDLLGRSPDYADTLMMRMYFDVNKNRISVSI